jgi:hypothetical protein
MPTRSFGLREASVTCAEAVSDGAAQLQVLQVEGRLGGAQREVDDESDEGDDEDQRQQAGRQAPAAAAQAVLVRVMVLPLLLAHDDAALRRCGVAEQLNCELVSFSFFAWSG